MRKKSHLYALIWDYSFINFQQKVPPMRLFSPIFLLLFKEFSLLYFYSDPSSIRNSRLLTFCEGDPFFVIQLRHKIDHLFEKKINRSKRLYVFTWIFFLRLLKKGNKKYFLIIHENCFISIKRKITHFLLSIFFLADYQNW
jgi:hypothetical protein